MEFLPKKALDYKYGGAGTSAFLKDQLVQVTKEGTQCGKAVRVLDPAWKMTDGGLELKVSVTDKKSDERFMSNGIIFLDNNQLGTNGNSRKSLRVVLVIDCCLRLLN